MKLGWLSVAACALIALGGAWPARAGLVFNGDFETGDFSGWSTQAAATGTFFDIALVPHSGAYSAGFGALSFQHDQIYQVLSTTAGQTYTLEFWLYNAGSGADSFQVAWEGGTVFDQTPVTLPTDQWSPVTLNLLATTSGSELRFRGYDAPVALFLDDVSVTALPTAIPAPGSVVLGLLGLTGVAASRRRS